MVKKTTKFNNQSHLPLSNRFRFVSVETFPIAVRFQNKNWKKNKTKDILTKAKVFPEISRQSRLTVIAQ